MLSVVLWERDIAPWEELSLMVRWVVGSILHGVDPLSYFSFHQCSMTGVTKVVVCVILSGIVHIKEPLLLIGKSSPCGGTGFPLMSFTMSDAI